MKKFSELKNQYISFYEKIEHINDSINKKHKTISNLEKRKNNLWSKIEWTKLINLLLIDIELVNSKIKFNKKDQYNTTGLKGRVFINGKYENIDFFLYISLGNFKKMNILYEDHINFINHSYPKDSIGYINGFNFKDIEIERDYNNIINYIIKLTGNG